MEEEENLGNPPTLLSGELEPDTPAHPPHSYTEHNIRVLQELSRRENSVNKKALRERTARIQTRMYNTTNQHWPISGDQNPFTLYFNRRFDPQPVERYAGALERNEYPQIRSFLIILPCSAADKKKKGLLTEDMCQQEITGGYFTYRIV